MTEREMLDFVEEAARQGVEIELDADREEGVLWISSLERTSSKIGIGATVLGELCDIADDQDLVVRAAVDAAAERLIDWYHEQGFAEIEWDDDSHSRRGRIVVERRPD